ncbi:MAG: hypothetical protein JXA73_04990 [Acidobacteria bacterium]|nr:hypothetical protein [Acidobacteriota bacterium]
MFGPPITIRHQNSDLWVVPAKHFCQIFAAEVNRICSNPATKPEAVAVELGPGAAAAAFKWLQELDVGPDGGSVLPVMLALIRRNRVIRASLREKAIRLQMETGRDLTELPPEMLHHDLGFHDHAVLFLSPVDSIIEALRCALELRIPVYGVDLEETAGGIYEQAVIQDPQSIKGSTIKYLAENLPLACTLRDSEVDLRRETAMAARIKSLMQLHSKVLFTCGMAHWLKIEERLADESLQPAPITTGHGKMLDEYSRLVVHPVIAARHMDLFPALAEAYEKCRIPASCCATKPMESVQAETLFRNRLRKAYETYFSRRIAPPAKQSHDLDSISVFEEYLWAIQQLSHRAVPDLFMTIQAAQEMMSGDFVEALTARFMEFPWTPPDAHPGCAVLVPHSKQVREPECAALVDGDNANERRVFIRSVPSAERAPANVRICYQWGKSNDSASSSLGFTWRPWEYLISSMSSRAIQAGLERRTVYTPAVFEGSLLDGIDVKSTLRALCRGNDSMYVRDTIHAVSQKTMSPIDGFPVVWILHPGRHSRAGWKVLHEPSWLMEGHIKDIEAFRTKTKGKHMAAIIGYGYFQSGGHSKATEERFSIDHFYGILVFQPICWTNRQFARWAEITHYKRNPFYADTSLPGDDLINCCERKLGIRLDEHDWTSALMLMALPFCRDSLTVVLPKSLRTEPIVYEKARTHRVRIITTPLELFPGDQVSRLAQCQLVPAISVEPEIRYSESVEKAIGEKQTQNRELVPPEWLNFGAGR